MGSVWLLPNVQWVNGDLFNHTQIMKWYEYIRVGWTWFLTWTGYTQMKMILTRVDVSDKGLYGHLDCEDFSCVTLERHDMAIPTGTYRVTLYDSPVHGKVPLLKNVPHRAWIEIHAGNWEKDSKGCILVGTKRDGWAIDNSRIALDNLMKKLVKADEIWLTIK